MTYFLQRRLIIPIEATTIYPELPPTYLSNNQNNNMGIPMIGMIMTNCVALIPCVFPKPPLVKSILFLLKEPAYNKKSELKPTLNIGCTMVI